MNRLLIDITFLTTELKRKRPPHGLPRVILAYLSNYLEVMQVVYQIRGRVFIVPKAISQKIAHLLLQWDLNSYRNVLALIIKGVVRSEQVQFGDTYYLFKLDQNGMRYPNYFKSIKKLGINLLIVIHDLFPIDNPEYSDPVYSIQFENNIKSSLRHAKGLICVSHVTQHALSRYAQSIKLNSPPVLVATLASAVPETFAKKSKSVDGPYFVMISTLVARKNHLLLLHIWRNLAKRLGAKTPKLVIIGKRSAECSSTLALLDRCQEFKGKVIEAQVSNEELAHYLQHATALLFPTFAEGYGLPLIEALSNKVPVIASDLPIFHEIAGEIPDYLDPIDGVGWMKLIEAYAEEGSMVRKAQLMRLEHFKIPTWKEHFIKVDAFIQKLDSPVATN